MPKAAHKVGGIGEGFWSTSICDAQPPPWMAAHMEMSWACTEAHEEPPRPRTIKYPSLLLGHFHFIQTLTKRCIYR